MFSGIIDEAQPGGGAKKRQTLIKALEAKLDAPVVAYIASPQHPFASLTQQDIPLLVDMMTVACRRSKKAYLILQSGGGDGHAAEKIIQIYRNAFPDGFYVIVPQFAKSAATMVSLGSDRIVMGEASELGPIDPQIPSLAPTGQPQLIPARAYLSAISIIRERVKADPGSLQVYFPILQQLSPQMIGLCVDMVQFAEDFAKRWLPVGAMKGCSPGDVSNTVSQLIAGGRFGLHGSVISREDAAKTLKLNVEYWPPNDDRWTLLWEYYLRTIPVFLSNPANAKLFETAETSSTMAIQVAPVPVVGSMPSIPPRGPSVPTPGGPPPPSAPTTPGSAGPLPPTANPKHPSGRSKGAGH